MDCPADASAEGEADADWTGVEHMHDEISWKFVVDLIEHLPEGGTDRLDLAVVGYLVDARLADRYRVFPVRTADDFGCVGDLDGVADREPIEPATLANVALVLRITDSSHRGLSQTRQKAASRTWL
jgi:hypothetical protein